MDDGNVFGKILRQIYRSSVARDGDMLSMMMHCIVLSDSNGRLDMHIAALASTIKWDEPRAVAAIAKLMEPDPESRTKDFEGRRLIPLDAERSWGWIVVNKKLYRDSTPEQRQKQQNAERQRRFRENQKKARELALSQDGNRNVTDRYPSVTSRHTDTDEDTDRFKVKVSPAPDGAPADEPKLIELPAMPVPTIVKEEWKQLLALWPVERRERTKAAESRYVTERKKGATHEEMLQSARTYLERKRAENKEQRRRAEDTRYVMQIATFLSNWRDYLPGAPATKAIDEAAVDMQGKAITESEARDARRMDWQSYRPQVKKWVKKNGRPSTRDDVARMYREIRVRWADFCKLDREFAVPGEEVAPMETHGDS
jgi:hypothetical protein